MEEQPLIRGDAYSSLPPLSAFAAVAASIPLVSAPEIGGTAGRESQHLTRIYLGYCSPLSTAVSRLSSLFSTARIFRVRWKKHRQPDCHRPGLRS